MSDHTEEQQVEELKKWWADNGRSIIAGVVIGIAIIGGWKGWNSYQESHAMEASAVYQQVMRDLSAGRVEAVYSGEQQLLSQYSDTPYAALGAMALAKAQIDAGQLAEAEAAMHTAVERAFDEDLRQLASLRLARILIAQEKHSAAAELLAGDFAKAFAGLADEIRGDLYLAQGDAAKAREAYGRASSAGNPVYDAGALDMKLNDLAEPNT